MDNKLLSEEIINILERNNFSYISEIKKQGKEYYVEFGQYTPAGEDWCETAWFDGSQEGFVNAVRDLENGFDVDEETEFRMEMRGKNGCPNSIETLVDDAKWKKEQLERLAVALENPNAVVPASPKAILRVVVNYTGTQFFSENDSGYVSEHASLKAAEKYILNKYGRDTEIEVETSIRFTY